MADAKITALTANTTPAVTDILPMVDDPSGSALTQKITISNFFKVINGLTEDTAPDPVADFLVTYDTSGAAAKKIKVGATGAAKGWNEVSETWTYASANTITVPTDATTKYQKGMGIRWKQGGGYKYAYVTIVAATLLTVTGGTNYTVANSAITDIAYTLTPTTAVGFPVSFTCAAPTWSTATIDNGTGGQQPTAGSSNFVVRGNKVELFIALGSANVVKNGAGTTITVSTIPSTLPSISSPTSGVIGFGLISSYVCIVYYASATSFSILSSTSIADNTSIVYSNFKIEYVY